MQHSIYGGHYMSNVYLDYYESPIGLAEIKCSDKGIRSVKVVELKEHATNPNAIVLEVKNQLDDYFKGRIKEFDLPLDAIGTDFQKKVWKALLTIPYGVTTSYGEIAKLIGKPTASRAVGAANGKNPIWIIVPCHRVIGASGKLTGYAGGLDRKKWLLEKEQS